MPAQVAILHGWSDTSKSFDPLRQFLVRNGHEVAQIWLGDYVSLDDDVRVEDVAKRMQAVVQASIAKGDLTVPFDLIVHSTGGLVAREWIATYFSDGAHCPVKRVVMLAPANFGSKLAHAGKSMIGRVAKGWNNWFQTGEQMLESLELASAYQGSLAQRDLIDPAGSKSGPYGPAKVWPFVITGSRAYADGLRRIVNENGSDGTVRVAAANLNVAGLTVDFSHSSGSPLVSSWSSRVGFSTIPFAALPDRDHGGVTKPELDTKGSKLAPLGALILEALACSSPEAYAEIAERWRKVSDDTAMLGRSPQALAARFPKKPPDAQSFHQHFQIVLAVRDDHGRAVDDYFIEFFTPCLEGSNDSVFFHREVMADVHVNTIDRSRRCFFVDRTDLMERYYPLIPDPAKRQIAISLSAAPIGRNVRYFDSTKEGAAGHLTVHEESHAARAAMGEERLRRNCTHFVDIIIPRQPVERVFRLTR